MPVTISKDSSTIGLNATSTQVRGGGFGKDAWVAQILGIQPDKKLKRKFCKKNIEGLSSSRKSGNIEFEVTEPGIYEFRDFCQNTHPNRWRWSGFFEIDIDSEIRILTLDQVVEKITKKYEIILSTPPPTSPNS